MRLCLNPANTEKGKDGDEGEQAREKIRMEISNLVVFNTPGPLCCYLLCLGHVEHSSIPFTE